MCIFSESVDMVSNTNIFARAHEERQFLVYSMTYAATTQLAMVLPLPVPPNSPEDTVRFINLEAYPGFFVDMLTGFSQPRSWSLGADEGAMGEPLAVHSVGSFEASFVPRIVDFDRLDERFRVSPDVWHHLPQYSDYGFAVFKLKENKASTVHPMAFDFPRRNADQLFFPTVHVHDGRVPLFAKFDHTLFCQESPEMDERHLQRSWQPSREAAAAFIDIRLASGIVDSGLYCWKRSYGGLLENTDISI